MNCAPPAKFVAMEDALRRHPAAAVAPAPPPTKTSRGIIPAYVWPLLHILCVVQIIALVFGVIIDTANNEMEVSGPLLHLITLASISALLILYATLHNTVLYTPPLLVIACAFSLVAVLVSIYTMAQFVRDIDYCRKLTDQEEADQRQCVVDWGSGTVSSKACKGGQEHELNPFDECPRVTYDNSATAGFVWFLLGTYVFGTFIVEITKIGISISIYHQIDLWTEATSGLVEASSLFAGAKSKEQRMEVGKRVRDLLRIERVLEANIKKE